jgi:hypothetical protein
MERREKRGIPSPSTDKRSPYVGRRPPQVRGI